MAISKDFWESLGISIDDIIDKQVELREKIFQRLANKLENLSQDYFHAVKDIFNIRGDSFTEILQSLYSSSKSEFLDLFALAVFAEKNINPEIIYDVASGKLKGDFARRLSDRTIDSSVVLLPLLKTDQENIRRIHYMHLVQRSALKKHVCDPKLQSPTSLSTVTSKRIETLLQKFEKKKRAKLRRPVKLWWFDNSDGRMTIVFRREKNASTQIKLVERNMFRKTGDEKIFIISDGGNVLELCSKREPKRTIKVAEFIASELAEQSVKYSKFVDVFDSTQVEGFINRLTSNEIKNAELLSIKVRNVPLSNSPMIEMQCSECLVPAIKDLEEIHNLSIIRPPSDILNLQIRFDGRSYSLRTRVEGNKIEFISDNKNLRDLDKQKISKFLNDQINQ